VDYFDYVHARHTVMAIKDWPKLMRRVFEYNNPRYAQKFQLMGRT